LSEPPEQPAPQEIVDLTAVCIDYVRNALDLELDLSAETLPVLDHYVRGVRATIEGRDELGSLVARAVGAYFGELARRSLSGFWRIPSPNLHDWAVCGSHVFLSVNPIGVAYDALAGGTEHGGPRSQLRVAPEYRAAVDARLANLPEVTDDEFYLLSTRLEAIEIAADELRVQMSRAGYEGVDFDAADYEAEARPLEN
jgi:hypothetical protein